MRKFLLLISLVLASGLTLTAQTFRLIDLNGNDMTNATHYDVVDTASLDAYVYHLDVVNLTANPVSINCARTLNNLVAISESYFCWDQCYSPIVDLAQPLTAAAFDTIKGFFGAYLNTYQQAGVSVMRYQFFNTANVNDTANFTLVLNAGTLGVKSLSANSKNKIGNAYPNPASNVTSIKYSVENAKETSLKITNELGEVVYIQQLENNKGTLQIPTSNFAAGIYFYSLSVGNANMEVKKLVITQ
jgi:hypothetical protein